MRVLIVHNILWAHYKSLLFSRLSQQFGAEDSLLVIQLALTEGHRKGLGMPDASSVGYPFQVLHKGSLDELPLVQRIGRLIKAAFAFRPDVVLLTGYYDPAQLLLGTLLKLRGCRWCCKTNPRRSTTHAQGGANGSRPLSCAGAMASFASVPVPLSTWSNSGPPRAGS